MIVVYINGQRVGTLSAEEERVLTRLAGLGPEVEFRDGSGKVLSRLVSTAPPPEPLDEWDHGLTEEEIQRRSNEPGGMTLNEFWVKMGVR